MKKGKASKCSRDSPMEGKWSTERSVPAQYNNTGESHTFSDPLPWDVRADCMSREGERNRDNEQTQGDSQPGEPSHKGQPIYKPVQEHGPKGLSHLCGKNSTASTRRGHVLDRVQ